MYGAVAHSKELASESWTYRATMMATMSSVCYPIHDDSSQLHFRVYDPCDPHLLKLPRGICSVPCQLVYVRRLNSPRPPYRPARLVRSAFGTWRYHLWQLLQFWFAQSSIRCSSNIRCGLNLKFPLEHILCYDDFEIASCEMLPCHVDMLLASVSIDTATETLT